MIPINFNALPLWGEIRARAMLMRKIAAFSMMLSSLLVTFLHSIASMLFDFVDNNNEDDDDDDDDDVINELLAIFLIWYLLLLFLLNEYPNDNVNNNNVNISSNNIVITMILMTKCNDVNT